MQLEVSPTGGDLINVSGSLQLGGTIQIYTNGASLAGKVFIPLITSSSVNLLIPPSSSFVSFGGPIVDPATGDYLYSAQGIANILVPQSANLKPIELLGTSDVLELAPTLDSPLVAVYNRVTSIYDTIKIEGGLVNEQTAEVLSAIGYELEANPEFPALEALGEFIETAEPDMIAFGKATDSLPDLPDLPDPPVPTINPSGLINQTIAMTFNAIDANGQTLFNRLLTLRSDINSVQAAITANEPILDLVNQLSTDASNFVSLNKTQSALWKQVESELEAAGIPNFSITQSDIASYVDGVISNGFSAYENNVFADLGFSPAEIASLSSELPTDFSGAPDTLYSTINEASQISGAIGSVPEPSTWAMMLAGFAGLGYAGYRQKEGKRRFQNKESVENCGQFVAGTKTRVREWAPGARS